jgi:hypothetical protein
MRGVQDRPAQPALPLQTAPSPPQARPCPLLQHSCACRTYLTHARVRVIHIPVRQVYYLYGFLLLVVLILLVRGRQGPTGAWGAVNVCPGAVLCRDGVHLVPSWGLGCREGSRARGHEEHSAHSHVAHTAQQTQGCARVLARPSLRLAAQALRVATEGPARHPPTHTHTDATLARDRSRITDALHTHARLQVVTATIVCRACVCSGSMTRLRARATRHGQTRPQAQPQNRAGRQPRAGCRTALPHRCM